MDDNMLRPPASLLAGEIASKDTKPLGPEAAEDPSILYKHWHRSFPSGSNRGGTDKGGDGLAMFYRRSHIAHEHNPDVP